MLLALQAGSSYPSHAAAPSRHPPQKQHPRWKFLLQTRHRPPQKESNLPSIIFQVRTVKFRCCVCLKMVGQIHNIHLYNCSPPLWSFPTPSFSSPFLALPREPVLQLHPSQQRCDAPIWRCLRCVFMHQNYFVWKCGIQRHDLMQI